MSKKISFILPVYNEEEGIREFYKSLRKEIDKLKKYNFELIFINDGSSDSSFEILVELQKKDNQIKIVEFSRNFGHQAAISAGIDIAEGDAAVIMDTDLQDPPKVAVQLIEQWEKGFEVVYARRKKRKDNLFKRTTASMFYRLLNRLTEIEIPHDTGDFRLIDRKAIDSLKNLSEKNRYVRGLVSFIGFKQTAVIFDRDERFAGETKYPLAKMIKLSIDAFTGFSTAPLKLITHFGMFVSALSLIGIVYALILRLFFNDIVVSGWTSILLAVLFIGGVQTIMIGIVGSYIGRIYIEVQNRPIYIVSSIITSEESKQ